jgi:hypothetical protein
MRMIDYTLCLIFHQTVSTVLTASDSGFGKSRDNRAVSQIPAHQLHPHGSVGHLAKTEIEHLQQS